MLKSKLKKYKLMYRANLIENAQLVNNKIHKTLTIDNRRNNVMIANIEKFEDMLYKSENSNAIWDNNYLQYCDLGNIDERKRMISPMFKESKTYLISDNTIFDFVVNENIRTLLKSSDKVFEEVIKTKQFEEDKEQLKKFAKIYPDEVIETYEKSNNSKTI